MLVHANMMYTWYHRKCYEADEPYLQYLYMKTMLNVAEKLLEVCLFHFFVSKLFENFTPPQTSYTNKRLVNQNRIPQAVKMSFKELYKQGSGHGTLLSSSNANTAPIPDQILLYITPTKVNRSMQLL